MTEDNIFITTEPTLILQNAEVIDTNAPYYIIYLHPKDYQRFIRTNSETEGSYFSPIQQYNWILVNNIKGFLSTSHNSILINMKIVAEIREDRWAT